MVERVRIRPKVERVKVERKRVPDGIYNRAVQCTYCEKWYLAPCSAKDDAIESRDRCPNWQHLQDARLVDHLASSDKKQRVRRK